MYETLKFTEMTTRRVIDAKDKDGEKVYVKGHAKATYMSDGRTVDEAVNNKVDKVDGKQLSTEDFTTLLKQKLDGLSNYDDTEISQAVSKLRTDLDTLVSGDTTTAIKTFNEVIAFLDGISDTEDLSSIIASIEQQIAAKGTYTKPSTGIPKSDLASDVQTSLGKADTALQSIPSEYVTKSELGQKGYATTSYVNTNLNIFNTNLNKKQDKLVSGTNIKTINGNSILGSGDIVIEEGSSAYPVVDHGTSNGTFVLTPNIFHKWNSVSSLSLTLAEPTDNTICNEYLFEFKSGDSATTLTLPAGIGWISEPNIEPNLTYQGSIVNNVGIIVGSKIPSVFAIYVVGSKKYFSFDKNMTWEVFVNSAYNDGTFSISSGKVRLYDSYYVYYGSETTGQTSEQTIIENGTYNVM